MYILIAWILGFVVGGAIVAAITYRKPIGTLKIDTSDPDGGPYLFLELNQSIGSFYEKKQVVMEIDTQSYISHD